MSSSVIVNLSAVTATAHRAAAWPSRQGPVALHRASAALVLSNSWEGRGWEDGRMGPSQRCRTGHSPLGAPRRIPSSHALHCGRMRLAAPPLLARMQHARPRRTCSSSVVAKRDVEVSLEASMAVGVHGLVCNSSNSKSLKPRPEVGPWGR
jgi:hypothetical protein